MSTTTLTAEAIARRALEIYDAQEFDRIGEVLADDYQVKVVGATFTGLVEMRGMLDGFYGAFPDLEHHLEAVIGTTDPNETVFEIRVTATHLGPFHGPAGVVPPSGNSVEWFSGNVIRSDGSKLKSWNIYLDQVPVLSQIGYEFK
jgi:predicted ester cyclase